ncbi:MAG TPA: ferritin-like domain-containing protein [Methylomirabilota bacterium]|nr:ferritin-like domain-containing protein [Methylomirabilota bacterium]
MAAASAGLHEPVEKLNPDTPDIHRALVSLMEELEAVDWYRQRADACTDDQLRAILEHNMNEEIEHASMVLEWLRRKVPKVHEALKTYLFTSGDLTQIEEKTMGASPESTAYGKSQPRTTIGDLKGR